MTRSNACIMTIAQYLSHKERVALQGVNQYMYDIRMPNAIHTLLVCHKMLWIDRRNLYEITFEVDKQIRLELLNDLVGNRSDGYYFFKD